MELILIKKIKMEKHQYLMHVGEEMKILLNI